jgi:hypothetical protein
MSKGKIYTLLISLHVVVGQAREVNGASVATCGAELLDRV